MRKITLPGPLASTLAARLTFAALLVVPGVARADEPAPAAEVKAEERGGWDGRFVAGMSAFGVSAVSLGLGILSTYQVHEANVAIRTSVFAAQFTQERSVCVGAETSADPGAGFIRETCARGNTWNTLQHVMYGLHVGAAFAGVYLVVTSVMAAEKAEKKEAAGKGVAVVPVVSAGFGGVVVRGAF
ncbi:hypothetical protein [Polyangium sp. y55x31]|uniref:hypothetical protein n=1 Tax=Polyangium sp. y55x31 TaxID=3042688 RepID=UPI002482D813|nr:hypothetical protein [Polyangium sp. y55x31]MDI1481199.1 hypothetical protein [Polyangium sp. y55x31]